MRSVLSFPRHSARTQGFTLGAPRNFTVSSVRRTVLFLRSASGTERSNALWELDLDSGRERLIADPARLWTEGDISAEEQARRERARERATGIVRYACDDQRRHVAFTVAGRLFVADVTSSEVREMPVPGPVSDARPDPRGRWVAYVCQGSLRVVGTDGRDDHPLAEPEHDDATWGTAEFIAAEEMGRDRGYWWSPDGSTVLAAHVDNSLVRRWHMADPVHPDRAPTVHTYPAAGTANAEVTLTFLGLDGSRVEVAWDHDSYPYLVTVHWSAHGAPLLAVQTRDQRTEVVLTADPVTGRTREIARETDPHWVELKPGWPAWTPDGKLVRITAREGAYRLVVDGDIWTESTLHVRAVLDVDRDDILISAHEHNSTEVHVYRVTHQHSARLSPNPGVHTATRSAPITVLGSSTLDEKTTRFRVFDGTTSIANVESYADTPDLPLNITLLRPCRDVLRSALVLPNGYREQHGKLPVLLDPYGGPQAQRVLSRQQGYFTSQWFADQGFAVVITDGRGMAGRGPASDRALAGDVAGPPLADQIEALHDIAKTHDELDLTRVAIRGWSFGGYLAGLGVLRRPDIFHAAILGAPVCDWRLYDTHYTERYLGDPERNPDVYESNSLLRDAETLHRPMMLIHGTADDNVVLAHSLRLSTALTAAARSHTLLPLPGVSHMPTDENTTENLLLMQVAFLRDALNLDPKKGTP